MAFKSQILQIATGHVNQAVFAAGLQLGCAQMPGSHGFETSAIRSPLQAKIKS